MRRRFNRRFLRGGVRWVSLDLGDFLRWSHWYVRCDDLLIDGSYTGTTPIVTRTLRRTGFCPGDVTLIIRDKVTRYKQERKKDLVSFFRMGGPSALGARKVPIHVFETV